MTDELKAERAAFEGWMLSIYGGSAFFGPISLDVGSDGEYADFETYGAWLAWQARAKVDRTNTTNSYGDNNVLS